MSPTTFFRASLLLPIILPPFAWLLFKGMGTAILLMSMLFAGIPYLFFAAWMWVRLGRVAESRRAPKVIVLAPVLFLLPAGLAFVGWSGYSNGFDQYVFLSLITFLPFAFFILLFGYLYVALTLAVYDRMSRAGWIRFRTPP